MFSLVTKFIFLWGLLFGHLIPAWGQETYPIIEKITWQGLNKTKESTVRSQIELKEGDPLDPEVLKQSTQRLRNLLIFSEVRSETQNSTLENHVWLNFYVVEKWTLIPIAKFSASRENRIIHLGLYDPNLLGSYLELGVQYENFSGSHGGVFWFRNPHLFNSFLKFGFDIWTQGYEQTTYSVAGLPLDNFTLRRQRAHFFIEKEFHTYYKGGLSLDLIHKEIKQFTVTMDSKQTFTQAFAVHSTVGLLEHQNYLINSWQFDSSIRVVSKIFESASSFFQLDLEYRKFWLIDPFNFALRMKGHWQGSQLFLDSPFIGGLESIRGFHDAQFKAPQHLLLNFESRILTYASSTIAIQNIVFFDALTFGPPLLVRESLGTGLRIIFPKIYRLLLRLDAGFYFRPQPGWGLSFGLQQFF